MATALVGLGLALDLLLNHLPLLHLTQRFVLTFLSFTCFFFFLFTFPSSFKSYPDHNNSFNHPNHPPPPLSPQLLYQSETDSFRYGVIPPQQQWGICCPQQLRDLKPVSQAWIQYMGGKSYSEREEVGEGGRKGQEREKMKELSGGRGKEE